MSLIERAGLALLRSFDPETAHLFALAALRQGLAPLPRPVTSPRLNMRIAGLDLPNPIGLAAGFDKNAVALRGLARVGFGFVEVGAATPRPQEGNPRPRLYRLSQDRAVINRFGFNNEGAEAILERLRDRPKTMVLGLNLGANKDSADRAEDFARVLTLTGAHLDFATVNVSSPNTEALRDLQGAEALAALLKGVMEARAQLVCPIPIFLKIAPDLSESELAELADVALQAQVDAIIATNTTISRQGLKSASAVEKGGLSGAPLFDLSTRLLARLSHLTQGKLPLIGVGGISTPEQAYAKIRAGASALQLYTGLVYHGLSLVPRLNQGLLDLMDRDGFETLAEVVGTGREEWL
ncbi:MAG: quinone-dependent dihydroorotate dehydrogenase [Rhodobacteraceae bacterium]|nr:MAG: quinone-dependent dihydroorotate dehydrogenase [Paracoccaceae bacterium]